MLPWQKMMQKVLAEVQQEVLGKEYKDRPKRESLTYYHTKFSMILEMMQGVNPGDLLKGVTSTSFNKDILFCDTSKQRWEKFEDGTSATRMVQLVGPDGKELTFTEILNDMPVGAKMMVEGSPYVLKEDDKLYPSS